MAPTVLDNFDRKILELVQQRGELGPSELSGLVHLSASQCSRRLQRLRSEGYIARIAAILDPRHLNLGISAYLVVKLKSHSQEAERAFIDRVATLPEIISADYLTGEADFMLHVITRDLDSYSTFLSERLLPKLDIDSVRSSIILKRIKAVTSLPLNFC